MAFDVLVILHRATAEEQIGDDASALRERFADALGSRLELDILREKAGFGSWAWKSTGRFSSLVDKHGNLVEYRVGILDAIMDNWQPSGSAASIFTAAQKEVRVPDAALPRKFAFSVDAYAMCFEMAEPSYNGRAVNAQHICTTSKYKCPQQAMQRRRMQWIRAHAPPCPGRLYSSLSAQELDSAAFDRFWDETSTTTCLDVWNNFRVSKQSQ
jgi:hypothetical protein